MENKISVGVIGLCMGGRHLWGLIDRKAEVAAICDNNPAVLKKVGDEYNIPEEKRFTDWRDMLALEDMNSVIIATPDQLHREMCEEFIAAGKHIMCEKPLALTYDDLEAIVRAAEQAKTVFMVGQICRFTPAFKKAKELVDAGVVGELYYMESEYAHDYENILKNQSWRTDPKRHGVVGGGCHAVDLLRWFGGDVEEVFAYGTHTMLPNITYDDATVAVMKWSDRLMGKVFVSTGCKRPYTMRTQLWGSKGTILCDNTSDTMQLFTLGEDGISVKEEPEIIPININNHNVCHEFDVFADHVLNGTPVQMTAREGAKTVATCLAIVESSTIGKPLKPDYKF